MSFCFMCVKTITTELLQEVPFQQSLVGVVPHPQDIHLRRDLLDYGMRVLIVYMLKYIKMN